MHKVIDIVYFDAGGGHRATANALLAGLDDTPDLYAYKINIRDILNPIDPMRRWLGFQVEDVYNWFLKKGITTGLETYLRLVQKVIAWKYDEAKEVLLESFKSRRPNIIVS